MERSFLPLEQLRTIVLQITLMAPWLLIFHFGFRLEKQKALRLWSSPKLSRVFWTYGLITRIYLAEMYSTSDKVIFQPPKAQFFKTNSIDFYLFSNGCIFNPHSTEYYNFTFAWKAICKLALSKKCSGKKKLNLQIRTLKFPCYKKPKGLEYKW